MDKRRPEWGVRLFASNYKQAKGTFPRVVLQGNVTLDELADVLQERTGVYRADSTRAILSLMADLVEEYLIEGYSVSSETGTLSPIVTGLWSFDRLLPSARAQNKAEVRFVMSPRLKKRLDNPLFHQVSRQKTGPTLYSPEGRLPVNEQYERIIQPDSVLIMGGTMLLMNGDDPSCGLYVVDADTLEERCFFPREELLLNSRTQIMVRLKGDLTPGLYRLRVVSQCTTNPVPLKTPQEGYSTECYRLYAPDEEAAAKQEEEG